MSCIVAFPVASSLSDFDEDKFTRTCRAPRMAARFVNVDHLTPLLLPADFRDWVPAGQIGEQLGKAEDADRACSRTASPFSTKSGAARTGWPR